MHHLCNLPEQETLINNTATQRPKTTPDMVKPENTQPQALTKTAHKQVLGTHKNLLLGFKRTAK